MVLHTSLQINNSLNNTVGGNTTTLRNIISGNETAGVYILGALGCNGNVVKGNYIGIDKNGTTFIAGSSQNYGVLISNPVEANTIGGSGAGEGNVISGNSDGGTPLQVISLVPKQMV
jgi:trimeric autotransporter adhesin